jgi:hypothetical protein
LWLDFDKWLQLSGVENRLRNSEANLAKALFSKSQLQKELDGARDQNSVLKEKALDLSRSLQAARYAVLHHPAVASLKQEQAIRSAMEAECNAALHKLSVLRSLNLECQAWKERVLAANEARAAMLEEQEKALSARQKAFEGQHAAFKFLNQEAQILSGEQAAMVAEVWMRSSISTAPPLHAPP